MATQPDLPLPSFVRIACASAAFFMLMLLSIPELTSSGATQLHTGNLHEVVDNNELVFINFYADWCRFSQMLQPVFEEAANKVLQEVTTPGKVVFAKVDCDNQPHLSQQYKITKYPTIKLVRYGKTLKREYRGQRSADALSTYIQEQLKDPIHEHASAGDISTVDTKKRIVVGYFEDRDSPAYKTFQKTSSVLRDDCEFHASIGHSSATERGEGRGDHVVYRPALYTENNSIFPEDTHKEESYTGQLTNYDTLYNWVVDKCIPLVREITFANAEELTEEGLPFLILFYNPEQDSDVVKRFHEAVGKQLATEKNNINCLTADGTKFTHPLHHLGKAIHDLPLLAIDSFRHMYMYNKDVKENIDLPGVLNQFLADLQSGKLHREFHHGPDPDQPADPVKPPSPSGHLPKDTTNDPDEGVPKQATTPPESSFAKLLPSRNRYTIIRDEL